MLKTQVNKTKQRCKPLKKSRLTTIIKAEIKLALRKKTFTMKKGVLFFM